MFRNATAAPHWRQSPSAYPAWCAQLGATPTLAGVCAARYAPTSCQDTPPGRTAGFTAQRRGRSANAQHRNSSCIRARQQKPVIHQYGFPTVIPNSSPRFQHRHRCHTGNARRNAVASVCSSPTPCKALVQEVKCRASCCATARRSGS